jgi:hypothetical protein
MTLARLADTEAALTATTAALARADAAHESLEHEIAALRAHERIAGDSVRRVAATRRRLSALDERLTGAIGMVPTLDEPAAEPRVALGKDADAPPRKPKSGGNGRARRPGEIPPAPRRHD